MAWAAIDDLAQQILRSGAAGTLAQARADAQMQLLLEHCDVTVHLHATATAGQLAEQLAAQPAPAAAMAAGGQRPASATPSAAVADEPEWMPATGGTSEPTWDFASELAGGPTLETEPEPAARPAGVRARRERRARVRAGGRGRRVRRSRNDAHPPRLARRRPRRRPRRARRPGALPPRHRRHPRRRHRQRIHPHRHRRRRRPALPDPRTHGPARPVPRPVMPLPRLRDQPPFLRPRPRHPVARRAHLPSEPDSPVPATSPAQAVTRLDGRDPSRPDRDLDRPGRPPTPAIRVITSASQTTGEACPAPT